MNVTILAQAMNVTDKDVLSLMDMVKTSLTQDGMNEEFLKMGQQDRVLWVNAYVSAEVKKFSEFCISLLTNTEKKSAFDQYLFHKLKEV